MIKVKVSLSHYKKKSLYYFSSSPIAYDLVQKAFA